MAGAEAVVAQGRTTGRVTGQVLRGGRGLSEAAVFLVPLDRPAPAPAPLPIQSIDQIHLTFVPGMLVVTPGTEVAFMNSDPLLHNVFSPGSERHRAFDLGTYPVGRAETNRFVSEGVHTLLCHIHPEMVAYVVVTDAPFRTVSAADGAFRLDDVPPGRYEARVWHPRVRGEPRTFDLTVGDGSTSGLRLEVLR